MGFRVNFLQHHGILGQKWGTRNGPPYPLSSEDRSAREIKAEQQSKVVQNDLNDNYRSAMMKQYKNNSDRYNYYKNLSDKDIAAEIKRRQDIKKAVFLTAAALGTTVAVAAVIHYRQNLTDTVSEMLESGESPEKILENASSIMNSSLEDFKVVLSEGDELHRMVGFRDFDLEKVKDPTYVAHLKEDVAAYKLFLRDFVGNKERYDVTLKALEDIRVPTKERATQLVDKMLHDHPELIPSVEAIQRRWSKGSAKDKTEAIVYDMIHKGRVRDLFVKTLQEAGFNAVEDYHDINDKFTKQPLIILDPQRTLQKVGEKYVDKIDRAKTFEQMRRDIENFTKPTQKLVINIAYTMRLSKDLTLEKLFNMKG